MESLSLSSEESLRSAIRQSPATKIRSALNPCLSGAAPTGDNSKNFRSLKLSDIEIDATLARDLTLFFRAQKATLENLDFCDCTGDIDIVLNAAMTLGIPKALKLGMTDFRCDSGSLGFGLSRSLGFGLLINSNLKELSLHSGSSTSFTLTPEDARALEEGLSRSKLEILSIRDVKFSHMVGLTSSLRSLANGVRLSKSLTSVRLKSCYGPFGRKLNDEELSILLNGLEHNHNLESLDVSNNQCRSQSLSTLAKILDRTKIKKLNISCQSVGEDEVMDLSVLVASLGQTTTLESLELQYNKLGDRNLAYVVAPLKYNSIKQLNLRGNRITNTGLSILASNIPTIKGLEYLNIYDNDFDQYGVLELAEALHQERCTLKFLEFEPIPNHLKAVMWPDLNWAYPENYYETKLSLWPFLLERVNKKLWKKQNGPSRVVNTIYTRLRVFFESIS